MCISEILLKTIRDSLPLIYTIIGNEMLAIVTSKIIQSMNMPLNVRCKPVTKGLFLKIKRHLALSQSSF